MASSQSKGTDQGIKVLFTSSIVVAKTTDATWSSTDSVLQKEKAESGKPPRAFHLDWLNKFSWLRIEEEGVCCVKCRYDCGSDKGHTASAFFRPVHHIPKKRKTHDSDMH